MDLDSVVGAVDKSLIMADDNRLFDASGTHCFDHIAEPVDVPVIQMRGWFI
jgi:hypothetical protein